MSSQEKLLQDFLTKHPDLQQLTDAQIKSAMADMFGSGTGEQRIAYMLLRYGKLNDIFSWKDVRELIDSYTHVLNVDEEMVESVITTCMNAMGKPMPTPMSDYASQPKVTLVPYVPQQQNNRRVKVRNKAERQQQLDTHPQVPYPPYTLMENIRDYWQGIEDFILTTVIWSCGVVLGVPTYLVSLFFNYIGKGHWNVYLWCVYGVLCLLLVYKGIEKYINYKHSLGHPRNESYYPQLRLQKIIAKKGYTKKAEEIMRAAYTKARTIKNDTTAEYLASIFEQAYQDALEDVMCYFDDDDRWNYLETNEDGFIDLDTYSFLYEKFYGHEAFNPKEYNSEIFGRFTFNKPSW